MWCSTEGFALPVTCNIFSICITCMWLGRKSCFHTKERIVVRHVSHKILPDQSSAMPGTLLFVFSFPLTIGTPCNAELSPSLSHFSGQPALIRGCSGPADFINLEICLLLHLKLLATTDHKTRLRLKVKPHSRVTTNED